MFSFAASIRRLALALGLAFFVTALATPANAVWILRYMEVLGLVESQQGQDSPESQLVAPPQPLDSSNSQEAEAPSSSSSGLIRVAGNNNTLPAADVAANANHRALSAGGDLDLVLSGAHMVPTYDFPDTFSETAPESITIQSRVMVEAGDSLSTLLDRLGVGQNDTANAAAEIDDVFPLSRIREGWDVTVTLDASRARAETGRLLGVEFQPSTRESVRLARSSSGFSAELHELEMNTRVVMARGTIRDGLYADAATQGVPTRVAGNFISALRSQINFDRQVATGDAFVMLYEALFDENGNLAETGDLLYAGLTNRGTQVEAFLFEAAGTRAYYTRSGEGLEQGTTLLRKPVARGRMSSGFSLNRCISGVCRPHRGTDYAAPTGTPIYAAGDGVIDRLYRSASYGRYIRIRHDSTYQTAYAHMSRYASGMSVGTRVRQGQIIGYVGSTGRSTGPHLHYEVIRNGDRVNPLSDYIPRPGALGRADRARFATWVSRVDTNVEVLPTLSEVRAELANAN